MYAYGMTQQPTQGAAVTAGGVQWFHMPVQPPSILLYSPHEKSNYPPNGLYILSEWSESTPCSMLLTSACIFVPGRVNPLAGCGLGRFLGATPDTPSSSADRRWCHVSFPALRWHECCRNSNSSEYQLCAYGERRSHRSWAGSRTSHWEGRIACCGNTPEVEVFRVGAICDRKGAYRCR